MVILLLVFGKANAQYHINYHYAADSCHDPSFRVMLLDSTVTNYIETSYGDGTMDSVIAHYGVFTSQNHVYGSSGTYTVKQVWIRAGSRVDSITFSFIHNECGIIHGRLYHDKNSNCTLDSTEHLVNYTLEVDSAGTPIDTFMAYGIFYYKVYAGSTSYSFKALSTAGGLTAACPSSGTLTATSSIGSSVSAGDMGFDCSSSTYFDDAIHLVTHTGRHSDATYVTLTSTSCTPHSGTLTVTIDSKYTYSSSYPSGSASGHTITWNFSNLSVDTTIYFYVSASTSPWLTPGTGISTTAYLTHASGDTLTGNDSATNADTVTASWDPNDKQVSPAGNIPAGTKLTYTLSFENTGNAAAKNIHILDTLDPGLDASSMQLVTCSATPTIYSFIDPASQRTILKFDFPNINLPDTLHGNATGFIKFSINTKSSLLTGTHVDNRAVIYFDDNEGVMTNTVENTIHPLVVANLNIQQVSVYPNPVNNELIIKTDKNSYNSIQILNTMGQSLIQQSIKTNETHVNISNLIPGMYYILLRGSDGTNVQKIEKL
jgi:uncharacterized repeat protein (TIGR01451 family)